MPLTDPATLGLQASLNRPNASAKFTLEFMRRPQWLTTDGIRHWMPPLQENAPTRFSQLHEAGSIAPCEPSAAQNWNAAGLYQGTAATNPFPPVRVMRGDLIFFANEQVGKLAEPTRALPE